MHVDVNNTNNNLYETITPNEKKPEFQRALAVFQELEKTKRVQEVKPKPKALQIEVEGAGASSSKPSISAEASAARVSEVSVPLKRKQKGPIKVKIEDGSSSEQESNHIGSRMLSYIGYSLFGTHLEGREYDIEKERLMVKIQNSKTAFKGFPPQFRDDKELALKAVRSNGDLLYWVSDRLKQDKDVAIAALENDFSTLNYTIWKYVECEYGILSSSVYPIVDVWSDDGFSKLDEPNTLWSDKEFVLYVVKRQGNLIQHASEKLRNDKEVALAAYSKDENAHKYFGSELWAEKSTVLAQVRKDGLRLQMASLDLKNDKEVVLAAIRQNTEAGRFIGSKIWEDRETVLSLVEMNGWLLARASGFQDDKDVVLAAVRQNGLAITYASNRLQGDAGVKAACRDMSIYL